jgi:hypothetical protein
MHDSPLCQQIQLITYVTAQYHRVINSCTIPHCERKLGRYSALSVFVSKKRAAIVGCCQGYRVINSCTILHRDEKPNRAGCLSGITKFITKEKEKGCCYIGEANLNGCV